MFRIVSSHYKKTILRRNMFFNSFTSPVNMSFIAFITYITPLELLLRILHLTHALVQIVEGLIEGRLNNATLLLHGTKEAPQHVRKYGERTYVEDTIAKDNKRGVSSRPDHRPRDYNAEVSESNKHTGKYFCYQLKIIFICNYL